LPALDVRTSDAHLQGAMTLRPESWAGSGRVQLDAPGLAARVNGNISETVGRGSLQVDGRDLAQVQGWLQRLPLAMPWLDDWRTSGRANALLAWQGGWRDPAIQGELAAPSLALRPTARGSTPASAWTLQETRLVANGRLSDARLEVRGRAEQGQRRFGVDMAGRGGRSGPADAAVWRAQLPRLALSAQDGALGPGVWRLDARRALSARWLARPGQLELDAGEARAGAAARCRRRAA
jgi:translocation and assembly module TamB